MKKRIWALTLSLALAASFSACGNQPAENHGAASDRQDSLEGQPSPGASDTQKEGMTLTEWCDSRDCRTLEATIDAMFADQGMTFSVTAEEPDILIYNYQYTDDSIFAGMTQEDIDAYFTAGMNSMAPTLISDIGSYRSAYGLPLTAIRMKYISADGTTVYSADVDESWEASSPDDAAPTGAYDSLQSWIDSDEAKLALEATNRILSSSGLSMRFSAEGNIFVYEYSVADSIGLSAQSQEEMEASFSRVVEQQGASIDSVFNDFASEYGIVLDAVRFTFYSEDGTELYSAEIANK